MEIPVNCATAAGKEIIRQITVEFDPMVRDMAVQITPLVASAAVGGMDTLEHTLNGGSFSTGFI